MIDYSKLSDKSYFNFDCQVCNGYGILKKETYIPNTPIEEECNYCDGKGHFYVEKEFVNNEFNTAFEEIKFEIYSDRNEQIEYGEMISMIFSFLGEKDKVTLTDIAPHINDSCIVYSKVERKVIAMFQGKDAFYNAHQLILGDEDNHIVSVVNEDGELNISERYE